MTEPTPDAIDEATQRLHHAFVACVSGRGNMSDWQTLHVALFGATFQVVIGKREEKSE